MTISHNVLAVLFFKKTLKIMLVLPNYAKHYVSAIDKSLAESRICSTKILLYLGRGFLEYVKIERERKKGSAWRA